MRTIPLGLALVLLALPGCGEGTDDPATRTQTALREIFLLAANADPERLAPRIVYRGDDPRRRWADVCNAAEPEERAHVRRMGARVTA